MRFAWDEDVEDRLRSWLLGYRESTGEAPVIRGVGLGIGGWFAVLARRVFTRGYINFFA